MIDEAIDNLPFVTLAFGRFALSQIHVAFDDAPRPSTTELDELIATEWDRQVRMARESGAVLFDGKMLRYVDHTVQVDSASGDRILDLTVGPTGYRDFVGTNLYNSHRIKDFGWHRFSNPVGTTATLTSSDGQVCYGRRSSKVAFHAGHVHTLGGALEAKDQTSSGEADPFASVRRELAEEVALYPPDILDLWCSGLIRDKQICQPELLFEGTIRLTADELRERWRHAESKDEHAEIVTVPDTSDTLVPFITRCGPIAPVAVGALLLHGRHTWGEAWFRRAAVKLSGRTGPAGKDSPDAY
ncbi:MAG: NUDIX domain-containing protein [Planctomycetota bacterium]